MLRNINGSSFYQNSVYAQEHVFISNCASQVKCLLLLFENRVKMAANNGRHFSGFALCNACRFISVTP
jgi:hypothetical protein